MSIFKGILQARIIFRYYFWKGVMACLGGTLGRGTVLYEGIKIFMTKKSSVSIGNRCIFQQGAILSASDAVITLGEHVYLGEYTVLSARQAIEIGDNSILATHTFVVDYDHDFEDPEKPPFYDRFKTAKVTIGANVWIGAGCQILKGVTIGEGSVVGAGSVVTRDLPHFSVSVGVPARVIRFRKPSLKGQNS